MPDWISFFDSDHSIYVNARHRAVHARLIAQGMLAYIPAGASVLDYGCGEALHAPDVAARAGKLFLCEAAPHLRETLAKRFAGDAKIRILSPDDAARLPAGSLDVVVMHSVAQYLTAAEADTLFRRFRTLLKPSGTFVLGDILRPNVSALTDAIALLRLGAANGFFVAAVLGLLRTLLSDYWRLRQATGLTRYGEDAMIAKLSAAGFAAQRAPDNIGHNPARMTFVARRQG
jgi:SAM-dependent methyltransferase